MEEGVQKTEVRSQKRGGWKQWMRKFGLVLSAASFGLTLPVAGAALTGDGVLGQTLWLGDLRLGWGMGKHGIVIAGTTRPHKGIYETFGGFRLDFHSEDLEKYLRDSSPLRTSALLAFFERNSAYFLILPFWLIIVLSATLPVLELRRRYIERRDKRLFEQIKREKLGREGGGMKP